MKDPRPAIARVQDEIYSRAHQRTTHLLSNIEALIENKCDKNLLNEMYELKKYYKRNSRINECIIKSLRAMDLVQRACEVRDYFIDRSGEANAEPCAEGNDASKKNSNSLAIVRIAFFQVYAAVSLFRLVEAEDGATCFLDEDGECADDFAYDDPEEWPKPSMEEPDVFDTMINASLLRDDFNRHYLRYSVEVNKLPPAEFQALYPDQVEFYYVCDRVYAEYLSVKMKADQHRVSFEDARAAKNRALVKFSLCNADIVDNLQQLNKSFFLSLGAAESALRAAQENCLKIEFIASQAEASLNESQKFVEDAFGALLCSHTESEFVFASLCKCIYFSGDDIHLSVERDLKNIVIPISMLDNKFGEDLERAVGQAESCGRQVCMKIFREILFSAEFSDRYADTHVLELTCLGVQDAIYEYKTVAVSGAGVWKGLSNNLTALVAIALNSYASSWAFDDLLGACRELREGIR